MDTLCSSAISRSRTSRDRSMPRSRDQDSAAQMGHSRPAITRVGRTPTSSIISDVTMAPTPMERATRLSSTPKTRASTSSGAILPMSVNPPRSIRALPTPTKARSPSATACWGKTPISDTGTPQSVTPTANHAPSRRVSTSSDAASEPRTAPAPIAADSRPTPGSPVSSRSMATTTVSTVRAPRIRVCATARPMIRARSAFRLTARIPSAAARSRLLPLGADGRGGAS